jgi:hypothetical protein
MPQGAIPVDFIRRFSSSSIPSHITDAPRQIRSAENPKNGRCRQIKADTFSETLKLSVEACQNPNDALTMGFVSSS